MRRLVLGLVALAGCRQIFGVSAPDPIEDATVDVPLGPRDAAVCASASVECATPEILRSCTAAGATATDTFCAWGCTEHNGPAHCAALVPHGGAVSQADTTSFAGLTDQNIQSATIDGSAGTIINANGTIRPAGQGIQNGIEYEVRGGVAIFRMKSVLLDGDITFAGPYSIAIVVDGHLGAAGDFNLQGACTDKLGGPGGFAGGVLRNGGGGAGGGAGANFGGGNLAGGGGGGYGATGGMGGTDGQTVPGGATYGDVAITTLVGGSGGGAGNAMSSMSAAHGGGGGGALQLVANGDLAVTGTINAGGCGGAPGSAGPGGGGGGGTGGTLLLEAPTIVITGSMAANGGGGGGGGASGNQGASGALGLVNALGGDSLLGHGGSGGAGTQPTGTEGQGNVQDCGGGGGGVGRIRLETRTGAIGGLGAISPPLGSSAGTVAPADVD